MKFTSSSDHSIESSSEHSSIDEPKSIIGYEELNKPTDRSMNNINNIIIGESMSRGEITNNIHIESVEAEVEEMSTKK